MMKLGQTNSSRKKLNEATSEVSVPSAIPEEQSIEKATESTSGFVAELGW